MVFFGGVSQQKFLSLGPKSELAKIHLYLCGLTLVYTPEIYPFSPDKPWAHSVGSKHWNTTPLKVWEGSNGFHYFQYFK